MRKSAVALLIALTACGFAAGQAAVQAQDPPQDGVRIHDKHERHQLNKEQVRDLVTGFFFGRPIGSGTGGA